MINRGSDMRILRGVVRKPVQIVLLRCRSADISAVPLSTVDRVGQHHHNRIGPTACILLCQMPSARPVTKCGRCCRRCPTRRPRPSVRRGCGSEMAEM